MYRKYSLFFKVIFKVTNGLMKTTYSSENGYVHSCILGELVLGRGSIQVIMEACLVLKPCLLVVGNNFKKSQMFYVKSKFCVKI